MGALPVHDYPEDRERLYLEELREFFSTQGLHSGSPEDIVPFVDKLSLPGLFRDDMRSMVRSIIFRERGSIPLPRLIEVVTIAVAGSRIDDPPAHLVDPARKLRAFLGDVVRSRWGMAAVENEETTSPPAEQEMPTPVDAVTVPMPSIVEVAAAETVEPPSSVGPLREPHTHPNIYSHPRAMYPEPNESGSFTPSSWTRRHSFWFAGICAAAVVAIAATTLHHDRAVTTAPKEADRIVSQQSVASNTAPTIRPAPSSKPTAYGEPVKRGRGIYAASITQLSHDAYAAPAVPAVPAVSTAPPAAMPEAGSAKPPTQPPAPIYRVTPLASQPPVYASSAAPLQAYAMPPARFPARVPATTPHRWINVSSGVMAGKLVSAPAPHYPKLASFVHLEGKVVLLAIVSRDGSVIATQVLRGHRLLRGAAADAVRQWRYRPYVLNGKPMDVATVITVDFRR